MKAVVVTHPGGPEVLEVREVPDPPIGPDEVRVAVRATALNRADLLQRLGRYPAPPGAPADVPGLEFAGEVEALGERVAALARGDRVMGLLGGGGYAGKVALDARLCVRLPPGLSWEEAAAIPEAFMTAFDALFELGRLVAGESVLLHAAASGVGTAAAQIARAFGARAIGLARSPAKRRLLEELGSTASSIPRPRTSRTPSVAPRGARWTSSWISSAPRPGRSTSRSSGRRAPRPRRHVERQPRRRRSLAPDAEAAHRGRDRPRSRPLDEKIALTRAFERDILPLIADGRLRPIVDRVFPLESAAAAHAAMESNANFGKIVLRVS